MSTFSSVVNKSDKKFAPKAAARRNVPSTVAQPKSSVSAVTGDQHYQGTGVESTQTLQPSVPLATLSLQFPPPTHVKVPIPTSVENARAAQPVVEGPSLPHTGRNESAGEFLELSGLEQVPLDGLPSSAETIYTGDSTRGAAPVSLQRDGLSPHAQCSGGKRKASTQLTAVPSKAPCNGATQGFRNRRSAPVYDTTRTEDDLSLRSIRDANRSSPPSAITDNASVNFAGSLSNINEQSATACEDPQTSTRRSSRQNTVDICRGEGDHVVTIDEQTKLHRPSGRQRQKRSMAKIANDIVGDIIGDSDEDRTETTGHRGKLKQKKRPSLIGEAAERHTIVPTEVTMSQLTRDTGLGKRSRVEAALGEINWVEVKKKQQEAEAVAEKQRQMDKEERRTGRTARSKDDQAAQANPHLVLRNGQIVVDDESRVLDRHEGVHKAAAEVVEATEENRITRRINQFTVGRPRGIAKKGRWDESMTELFHKGLRMFGTDFMMISKMFPGMSRRHIKLKYTREERANVSRVYDSLNTREEVDIIEFSRISDCVYEDPAKIHEELAAETHRLRAEDRDRQDREVQAEKEADILRAREETSAGADDRTPVDREGADAHALASDGVSIAKENRLNRVVDEIVQEAMGPSKKAKKKASLGRKRQARKKKAVEGIEEIVGSIEDV